MDFVPQLIERIEWSMRKSDVYRAFSDMQAIPPHPTQNAIGFVKELQHGTTVSVICYFAKKFIREKLGAVNFIIHGENADADQLNYMASSVKQSLTGRFGSPTRDSREIAIWEVGSGIVQMYREGEIIGVRYGDPRTDLASRIANH